MGKLTFPTADCLLSHMRLNGLGLVWTVPTSNRIKSGDRVGCLGSNGYRWAGFKGVSYSEHQLVWIDSRKEQPPDLIDHINGIRDDNRPQNLRAASRSQNAANGLAHIDNSTQVMGVHKHHDGRWPAQISILGKRHHLGCYETLSEARRAYHDAAKMYFGEYTRLEN
ncbi:MAG: HNH endonuclease [Pseudomonadota bacterium]